MNDDLYASISRIITSATLGFLAVLVLDMAWRI